MNAQATDHAADLRIQQKTEEMVERIANAGPKAIERRLKGLEHEWDVDRALVAQAGIVTLVGSALCAASRKWLLVPAGIGALLLIHAAQGRSPAVPLLRRLGYRTPEEIDRERFALKAMRGDFRVL